MGFRLFGLFVVVSVVACMADRAEEDPRTVAGVCIDPIERLARFGARWTTDPPSFPFFEWLGARPGFTERRAIVRGDSIEFQNGFGAWMRHRYSCTIDVSVNPPRVLDVSADPGRLPAP